MVETLFLLALSAGLSLWAASLRKKPKNKNFIRDDRPTTLAERGSYIPVLIGTRRIGYVFSWAGNRKVKREVSGSVGGKGSKKKKQYTNIYIEDGFHCVAVGPGEAIHEITQDGTRIYPVNGAQITLPNASSGITVSDADDLFRWALTRERFPSGTQINLGKEGSFKIHWGECGQPIIEELNAGFGIQSRWPGVLSVLWIKKRLGPSPNWGAIDYVAECKATPIEQDFSPGPVVVQDYYSFWKFSAGGGGYSQLEWNSEELGYDSNYNSSVILSNGDLIFGGGSAGNQINYVDGQTGEVVWSMQQSNGAVTANMILDANEEYIYTASRFYMAKIKVSDGTEMWNVNLTSADVNAEMQDYQCVVLDEVNGRLLYNGDGTNIGVGQVNIKTGVASVFKVDTSCTGTSLRSLMIDYKNGKLYHFGSVHAVDSGDALYDDLPVQTSGDRFSDFTVYDLYSGDILARRYITLGMDTSMRAAGAIISQDHLFIGGMKLSLRPGFEYELVGFLPNQTISNFYFGTHDYDEDHYLVRFQVDGADDIQVVRKSDMENLGSFNLHAAGSTPDNRLVARVHRFPESVDLTRGVKVSDAVRQLVCAPYPHGAGIPHELLSESALQEMETTLTAEGYRVNLVVPDGDSAAQALAELMQDIGFVLRDEGFGLVPKLVRPVNVMPQLREEHLYGAEPEITYKGNQDQPTRLVFLYADESQSYKSYDIQLDNNGENVRFNRVNTKEVQITTVTKRELAQKVVDRREQEELAGVVGYSMGVIRDARNLRAGDSVRAEDGTPLLITENELDLSDRRATLKTLLNNYGQPIPVRTAGDPGASVGTLPPEADDFFYAIEAPAEFSVGGTGLQLLVFRHSAHNQIAGSDIHLSADDASFEQIGFQNNNHNGGTLDEALDIDAFSVLESGPLFTAAPGADPTTLSDLTGQEDLWRSGGQIAVFIDPTAEVYEICYLRNVEAVGGNQYRLRGLIRERAGTENRTFPIGSRVVILDAGEVLPLASTQLSLNQTFYVRSQPFTLAASIPLSSVPSREITIVGEADRPLPVDNFFANFDAHGPPPVNQYGTSDDVEFTWTYRIKPGTGLGAGELRAGVPIGNESPTPEGTFEIEMLTVGDVSERLVTGLSTPSYTYDNADLISDFGSEVTFKARVRHVAGAYASDWEEITITKV